MSPQRGTPSSLLWGLATPTNSNASLAASEGMCCLRELPGRSQGALRLIQLEDSDGACGRVGKVQPAAIRAHTQAVRDPDIRQMATKTTGAVEGVQAALGGALVPFDHRTAPETTL